MKELLAYACSMVCIGLYCCGRTAMYINKERTLLHSRVLCMFVWNLSWKMF